VGQSARLLRHWRQLRRTPRPDKPALVVTLPGYTAPEASMAPIGWYLGRLGHRVVSWGLGTNRGDVAAYAERLLPRLRAWVEAHGEPAVLVGWSLGGVVAREVARLDPSLTAGLVTYGTPVVGGPNFTVVASGWSAARRAEIAARVARRDARPPLPHPMVVLFTRTDRIVSWPACIDRVSPNAVHVEVASSHTGMGFDPDVWTVVAEAVAGRGRLP
jgi:pimeloyl-ACP methyl ester carboxylesterase